MYTNSDACKYTNSDQTLARPSDRGAQPHGSPGPLHTQPSRSQATPQARSARSLLLLPCLWSCAPDVLVILYILYICMFTIYALSAGIGTYIYVLVICVCISYAIYTVYMYVYYTIYLRTTPRLPLTRLLSLRSFFVSITCVWGLKLLSS
jgi:hypothetical protein